MNTNKKTSGFQNRVSDVSSVLGCTPSTGKNGHEESPSLAERKPVVDITEDKREFLIQVELSEVKKKGPKVVVENGILTISEDRNFVMGEERMKCCRINLVFEHFKMTFMLTDHADVEKVSADFKHGLLKVRLPKKENANPERFEILIG